MRQLILVIAAACGTAPSPRPPAQPPRTLTYSVVTAGRVSGGGEVRIDADGTRRATFEFNDRGRGPKLATEMRLDAAGAPRMFRATGRAYMGQPVDEVLEERAGKLAWHSPNERGEAAGGAGFYVPANNDLGGELVRAMLRAPNQRVKLLPAGEAWIEADTVITIDGKRLHQVAYSGFDFAPSMVWLDEDLELFAVATPWISTIRAGSEALIPKLVEADGAWTAARSERLAKQLSHRPPDAGLAFTHARVFDAERKVVVPDATVVVRGDKIVAVGDAKTKIPDGAQVIDAKGRMLLPGLWDMHCHIGPTEGILGLAGGITTIRDLGGDIDDLGARTARITAGTELGPTVIKAGLIDGPGKLAAPAGILVSTEEEARAAVKRYADLGYVQIKIYSSVKPELVPVIAEAAHARGLRVSGHIPTTMTAQRAVELGFDEIQHANFLFLNFLAGPEDDTRTPLRFTRVAERGASLDLDGTPVRAFLDLLASKRTVIDPTVSIFEAMFTNGPGELVPTYTAWKGRLPAQIERFGYGLGLEAPGDQRATFRASFATMLALVKRAFDRGIPIVAGTDGGATITFTRELELYVQAGIPAAEVLALATLGAARVMRQDREVGSIAVGKRADLILVDGDPTRDIATIRNTDVVVARGVVYDPKELFAAVGIRAR